jgi:hypothetical protein
VPDSRVRVPELCTSICRRRAAAANCGGRAVAPGRILWCPPQLDVGQLLTFADKLPGRAPNVACLDYLRPGGTLVVTRLDRFLQHGRRSG